MFLYIPLIILGAALLGVGIIVGRKMSYLAKLAPEAHEYGDTIWHDLMPELIDSMRSLKWKEYRQNILGELEKFVRRIKLFFVSIERVSDHVLQKIRRTQRRQAAEISAQPVPAPETVEEQKPKPKKPSNVWFMNAEQLHLEEQKLIVSIAQDPKNVALYQTLGDVYMRLKEYRDAVESFQAALKLDPENSKLKDKLAAAELKAAKEEPEKTL